MFEIVDAIRELQEALADARAEIAALRAAHERVFRKGKVTDVDPEKQIYRQEIGQDEDGKPVKGPWVPYGQVAGALKHHSPPSVGQQMMQVAPDGDFEQAFGLPYTFSNDNPSPSKRGDEDVVERGAAKDVTRGDSRTISVGGASISVVDGKIVLKAGTIVLDGDVRLGGEGAERELALRDSVDSHGDVETSNLSTKVKAI